MYEQLLPPVTTVMVSLCPMGRFKCKEDYYSPLVKVNLILLNAIWTDKKAILSIRLP